MLKTNNQTDLYNINKMIHNYIFAKIQVPQTIIPFSFHCFIFVSIEYILLAQKMENKNVPIS